MRYDSSPVPRQWSNLPGKDLLQSRAFWGIAFVLLASVLRFYGYSIEDQEEFISRAIEVVEAAFTLIGAGLSLWGTVSRKEPIKSFAGMRLR